MAGNIDEARPGAAAKLCKAEDGEDREELVGEAKCVERVDGVKVEQQAGFGEGSGGGEQGECEEERGRDAFDEGREVREMGCGKASEPEVEDEGEDGAGVVGGDPLGVDVGRIEEVGGEQGRAESQTVQPAPKKQEDGEAGEEVGNEP
jgi:hypothetical protein